MRHLEANLKHPMPEYVEAPPLTKSPFLCCLGNAARNLSCSDDDDEGDGDGNNGDDDDDDDDDDGDGDGDGDGDDDDDDDDDDHDDDGNEDEEEEDDDDDDDDDADADDFPTRNCHHERCYNSTAEAPMVTQIGTLHHRSRQLANM